MTQEGTEDSNVDEDFQEEERTSRTGEEEEFLEPEHLEQFHLYLKIYTTP